MTKAETMRALCVAASLVLIAAAMPAQAAGSQADFDAALKAAQDAENEAGALKNRWIPAEQALAAAKKAAAAGDFDTAVKDANRAEALARASIAQAKEQETAWQALVIH